MQRDLRGDDRDALGDETDRPPRHARRRPSLALGRWILADASQRSLARLREALDRERISFTSATRALTGYIDVTLTLTSGVELQFVKEHDGNLAEQIDPGEMWLTSFSLR